MHKIRSLSAANLAKAVYRFIKRPKTTGGRPSAPLGSRILTNPDDVFKHNMWDHIQWSEEEKKIAKQKAQENSCVKIPITEQGKFDTDAHCYWDKFYERHQNKFFKDRHWLFLEFPELLSSNSHNKSIPKSDHQTETCLSGRSCPDLETSLHQQSAISSKHIPDTSYQEVSMKTNEDVLQNSAFPGQHAPFRILEVGCGVGNSVFPIIKSIKESDAFLYCCDFSSCAIEMVKNHQDYDDSVCHAFVHDICEEKASFPFPPQSLDVVLAVFVLSSIHPVRLQGVVNTLSTYLKHGGIFLFRDYGRYDLSQLRFKKGRCLSENFYTRGDGTCVYFFTKEEVHNLFSKAGLEEIQNLEDRRLQVNRGKKVAMHRVWMQSKYRRPFPPLPP
ncbi:tRNA N(3)-cytidine methyltransferase METTL8, mitochondrial [Cynoglossus semilaevis]|uniref:tRNA N(3)-cytidine methyltransferase METTL8, mitochondrial n=1 Tax=Cynoglossus semilaevis TaxID=244447 RepID=UPI000497E791|nr:methyltransferase-like protein 8 [Cynoglossus semilaevis]